MFVPGSGYSHHDSLRRGRGAIITPPGAELDPVRNTGRSTEVLKLKSIECTAVDSHHLAMTATCLEEEIISAPRVRDLSANILASHCMFCLLAGKDKIISRPSMDQHGVILDGSPLFFEGNETGVDHRFSASTAALPTPAQSAVLLFNDEHLIRGAPCFSFKGKGTPPSVPGVLEFLPLEYERRGHNIRRPFRLRAHGLHRRPNPPAHPLRPHRPQQILRCSNHGPGARGGGSSSDEAVEMLVAESFLPRDYMTS